jgi:hypothetical protein
MKYGVLVVDCINYLGCHYRTYHFEGPEGITFWNVVVGGLKWSDMEGPCA